MDGHCTIAADYVERCAEALAATGAAMVGGAMNPQGDGWLGWGIAIGHDVAVRRRPGPVSLRWGARLVDTVYLGAYPTALARTVGGYRRTSASTRTPSSPYECDRTAACASNRASDPPRPHVGASGAVTRQVYRYGRSRAATIRRHPGSLAPRQLVAPHFLAGLVSPWRRKALGAYAGILVVAAAGQARRAPRAVPGLVVTLPAMHLPWAAGFWRGIVRPPTDR